MLSYTNLAHLRLGDLKTAVEDWSATVTKFQQLAENSRGMETKTREADWTGANSDVTKQFVSKTCGEFSDALTQATSIRNILRDTQTKLRALKTKLNNLVDSAAKDNLTVSSDGIVTMLVHPDRAASGGDASGSNATKADELRNRISVILEQARDVDATATRALKTIRGSDPYDFTGVDYGSLSDADKAQALTDAKTAVDLASKGVDLTEKEMTKLVTLLRQNSNDHTFGTYFHKHLGPEGTLRFNAELSTLSMSPHPGKRLKIAETIQNELGKTLATATQNIGSPGYLDDRWLEELKKSGRVPVDLRDAKFVMAAPYGYQSLATLLDEGTYGTAFLNEISQDMIALDKELDGIWPWSPSEQWHLDLSEASQSETRSDRSAEADPLVNLLEANAGNPEAAQALFENRETTTYLLHSQSDHPGRGDTLGHALESAVMGVPYDTAELRPSPHSDAQVKIMTDVMNEVSLNGDLVSSEIGDSLGHMATAYMPEIHRAVVGSGAESVFPLREGSSTMRLESTDTARFLYLLAQEPDANAALTLGRNIYTSSLIEAHVANPDIYSGSTEEAITTVSEAAGLIEGIMAHSRQDVELDNKEQSIERAEKAMERQADWAKGLTGAGVGAAALALAPVTGGSSALIAAAGTPFFTTVAEQIVDRMYDDRVDDSTDDVLYRSGQDVLASQDSVTRSLQTASELSGQHYGAPLDIPSLNNQIRQHTQLGWSRSEVLLSDIIERPSR